MLAALVLSFSKILRDSSFVAAMLAVGCRGATEEGGKSGVEAAVVDAEGEWR